MKWVRSNIGQGSRLALFALAIQFVLSFGHFHPLATPTAPTSVAASLDAATLGMASLHSDQQQPASDHDTDQSSNDGCVICAVIALAHTVLFSVPPVLTAPQAVAFVYETAQTTFADLHSPRVAFQPRAPPIS